MPGAYAHITLVNLMKEPARLQGIGFSNSGAAAVLDYFKFCELGAVSPDYPYLAVTDSSAGRWADLMHYQRTGDVLRETIEGVGALTGEPRRRAFAWLLGYCAHVATDVTIHPVIELKVGPYAQNKTAHRICEMHQDVYIFSSRMNLGEIGVSEHLSSGILRCSEQGQPGKVDSTIRALWEKSLSRVHAEEAKTNPPQIDLWHQAFDLMVNKIAEEGGHLMPIARHVAVNCGLTYPALENVDHNAYISQLRVPGGGTLPYDAIFERAIASVGKTWSAVEKAVFQNDSREAALFGNWNLDTGLNDQNKMVFWA
jgi:hypothetical protein